MKIGDKVICGTRGREGIVNAISDSGNEIQVSVENRTMLRWYSKRWVKEVK